MSSENSGSENSLSQRLEFIGFDSEMRAALRKIKPLVDLAIGPALDNFYAKARETPEVKRFFIDDNHMKTAQGLQVKHWQKISAAEFDEDYVKSIQAIGNVHARLGIEPRWYIGAYGRVASHIIRCVVTAKWPSLLQRSKANAGEMANGLCAFTKVTLLDMDFGISTYLEALEVERHKAERARVESESKATRAIQAMARSLGRLAEGDLVSRMDGELAEEFAQLKSDFNLAVDRLQETMTAISDASDEIRNGSDEIAQGSDELSKRTEQQAASLEQTAATLEELTRSVQQTAKDAEQAAGSVLTAKIDAEQSNAVVKQAVSAMSEIESSSRKITSIIGVIDEIAFQTNLLALNAGVEAARAGDAGRGFAVVAQEVRALAQRSAAAAKEIKTLIIASSAEVGVGVGLVHQSSALLEQVITRVVEIDGLVGGIAVAAKEQASGLGEINSAVGQMDQLTQKNAAMVEEATAATYKLKNEVSELVLLIGRFGTGIMEDFTVSRPGARASAHGSSLKRAS